VRYQLLLGRELASNIRKIIHLPGLRGNPERNLSGYSRGRNLPGTFQEIPRALSPLGRMKADTSNWWRSERTWNASVNVESSAVRQNDTEVELQVGRLPHPATGAPDDLVSICRCGLGVSQTLPVLVRYTLRNPDRCIPEQPEITFIPRSVRLWRKSLRTRQSRGACRHGNTQFDSPAGIQALVAEGKLSPDKVSLNGLSAASKTRDGSGVRSVDQAGAFVTGRRILTGISQGGGAAYLDAAESALQG